MKTKSKKKTQQNVPKWNLIYLFVLFLRPWGFHIFPLNLNY